MSSLTITIEEEVLEHARMRAREQGTSIDTLLREYLEAYAGVHAERQAAARRILALSDAATTRRGDAGWTRDELHERR
jgi:hypothetical protein